MTRFCLYPFAAAGTLALTACASDVTTYPSLARRDVERAPSSPAPSPSATPDPGPDAELAARLTGLVASARAADQRFSAARYSAERTVASGSGAKPGSEAWAVASIALAGLESARSDAMIALADLDALFAGSRINGTGGAGAIAASRDEVSALVAEQDRIVATLSRHLGS